MNTQVNADLIHPASRRSLRLTAGLMACALSLGMAFGAPCALADPPNIEGGLPPINDAPTKPTPSTPGGLPDAVAPSVPTPAPSNPSTGGSSGTHTPSQPAKPAEPAKPAQPKPAQPEQGSAKKSKKKDSQAQSGNAQSGQAQQRSSQGRTARQGQAAHAQAAQASAGQIKPEDVLPTKNIPASGAPVGSTVSPAAAAPTAQAPASSIGPAKTVGLTAAQKPTAVGWGTNTKGVWWTATWVPFVIGAVGGIAVASLVTWLAVSSYYRRRQMVENLEMTGAFVAPLVPPVQGSYEVDSPQSASAYNNGAYTSSQAYGASHNSQSVDFETSAQAASASPDDTAMFLAMLDESDKK